jgi:hypothetical protein
MKWRCKRDIGTFLLNESLPDGEPRNGALGKVSFLFGSLPIPSVYR